MTRREIKRLNRNRTIGWFLLGVGWTATAMLIALLPLVYN
jgi:hypothetical protein